MSHQQVVPIFNPSTKPMTIVLEPEGVRHVLPSGERVYVVARGPEGGQVAIERTDDVITIRGWRESTLQVVPDDDDIGARTRATAEMIASAMRTADDPNDVAVQEALEAEKAALLEVYQVRLGTRPRTARTLAEMEFFVDLESCGSCGRRDLRAASFRGGERAWEVEARCAHCGTTRSFSFETKSSLEARPDTGELGAGPSRLISVEAFEAELARLRPLVATDARAWRRALVCINEIIKLARPGPEREQRVAQRQQLISSNSTG